MTETERSDNVFEIELTPEEAEVFTPYLFERINFPVVGLGINDTESSAEVIETEFLDVSTLPLDFKVKSLGNTFFEQLELRRSQTLFAKADSWRYDDDGGIISGIRFTMTRAEIELLGKDIEGQADLTDYPLVAQMRDLYELKFKSKLRNGE